MPDDGSIVSHPTAALARAPAAPGAVDYGLIVLQSVFWGSSFFFVAVARQDLPPLTLSTLRMVPASLLLAVIVAAMQLRLPATLPEWRRIAIFSALNNAIPFVAIIVAQREVTGGIAGIFQATAPLWSLILAPLFIAGERFTWRRLAGILIGICGVAVLADLTAASGSGRAHLLLLFSALCFSSAGIYARSHLGGYHPFVLASGQTIAALVMSGVAALVIDQPWHLANPGGRVWFAALMMGTFGSALAPLCYFTVLKRTGPVNASLGTILLPVTPILLGALFLGEHVNAREVVGGLIIAAALAIIDGRAVDALRRRLSIREPA